MNIHGDWSALRKRIDDFLNDKFGYDNRFAAKVSARKNGVVFGVIFLIFTCAVSTREETGRLAAFMHFIIPLAILKVIFIVFFGWYYRRRKKLIHKSERYDGYTRGIADASRSFIEYFYISYMSLLALSILFMI